MGKACKSILGSFNQSFFKQFMIFMDFFFISYQKDSKLVHVSLVTDTGARQHKGQATNLKQFCEKLQFVFIIHCVI